MMSDDGSVFLIPAEGDTVSVPVDAITSVRRSTEPLPLATVTVRRSVRYAEMEELHHLRQRVRELERELADARA